jgi:ribosome-associated protein
MSESYLEIQLDHQPIELCKLLKIADLVSGGGEAKVVISEGYVYLNGEVEYQKRKKVYHNDVVEFNGELIQVVISENFVEGTGESTLDHSIEEKPTQTAIIEESTTLTSPNNNKVKKAAPTNEGTAINKSKRKPISF